MTDTAQPDRTNDTQRLDKWLWHARFFKTRTLAAKICNGGHVRSGGQAGRCWLYSSPVSKPLSRKNRLAASSGSVPSEFSPPE